MVLKRVPRPTTPITPTSTMDSHSGFQEDFTHGDLVLRPRNSIPLGDHATVEINTLQDRDTFIVSIQPPAAPINGKRASCDIVLVIDVSGSMSAAAPLPEVEEGEDREGAGLSVLDLVKHAARTILETLGPGDRLGIVTFSNDAKVKSPYPKNLVGSLTVHATDCTAADLHGSKREAANLRQDRKASTRVIYESLGWHQSWLGSLRTNVSSGQHPRTLHSDGRHAQPYVSQARVCIVP
jgi:hypothetical protein